MFRFGKAAVFAIATAATFLSMAPAHAFSLGGQQPGYLTPFICDDDVDDIISSQIVNVNYQGHNDLFITSQLVDTDFSRDDNDDGAGAIVDGIGGSFAFVAFNTFSFDVLNSTIPGNLSRVKVKFFGSDQDFNHLAVTKNLSDAVATTGTGLSSTSPPVGFTRYTFTNTQLGKNFVDLNRVYIILRANKNNTSVGPFTFGMVHINGSNNVPQINFSLLGCPVNLNETD